MTQTHAPARGHDGKVPAAPVEAGFTVNVTPDDATMQVQQQNGTLYQVTIVNNTGVDGLFTIEPVAPEQITPASLGDLAAVKWATEPGVLHFEYPGSIVIGNTRDHTINMRAYARRGFLPPGDYPFTLRVSFTPTRAGAPDASQGAATAPTTEGIDPAIFQTKNIEVMLRVVAYSWCQTNIIPLSQPLSVGDHTNYTVSVNNRGNVAVRLRLSTREGYPANIEDVNSPFVEPEESGLLDFSFTPEEMIIPAGGGATATLRVRLAHGPGGGKEKDIPFSVDAVAVNLVPNGSYIVRPSTGEVAYTQNTPLAIEEEQIGEPALLPLGTTLLLIGAGAAALIIIWFLLTII